MGLSNDWLNAQAPDNKNLIAIIAASTFCR